MSSFFGASSPKGTRRAPVVLPSRSYARRVYDWVSAEERAPLVAVALKIGGFLAACTLIHYKGSMLAPEPMEAGLKDPYGGDFVDMHSYMKQREAWMSEQAAKAAAAMPATI